MKSINKTILTRRSIRSYTEKKPTKEEILTILEAGNSAPSGCNVQSWYFNVVSNKELLDEINFKTKKLMKDSDNPAIANKGNNPNYHIFFDAPFVVFVSYLENSVTPIEDISAATQNMLLQGEELGIGGCWNGNVTALLNSDKDIITKLNIPDGYKAHHAVSFGYTKVKPKIGPLKNKKYFEFIY